jgi:hypothetical protein
MNSLATLCENLAQVELLLGYSGLDDAARENLSSRKQELLKRMSKAGEDRVRELTRSN